MYFRMPAGAGTPRRRRRASILLLDSTDRVFLFEAVDPGGRWSVPLWMTVGGGVKFADAVGGDGIRELHEETGIPVESFGDCICHWDAVCPWGNEIWHFDEQFFPVRAPDGRAVNLIRHTEQEEARLSRARHPLVDRRRYPGVRPGLCPARSRRLSSISIWPVESPAARSGLSGLGSDAHLTAETQHQFSVPGRAMAIDAAHRLRPPGATQAAPASTTGKLSSVPLDRIPIQLQSQPGTAGDSQPAFSDFRRSFYDGPPERVTLLIGEYLHRPAAGQRRQQMRRHLRLFVVPHRPPPSPPRTAPLASSS